MCSYIFKADEYELLRIWTAVYQYMTNNSSTAPENINVMLYFMQCIAKGNVIIVQYVPIAKLVELGGPISD